MRAALEGKIAVVTGGAKGVGRAVCHALARSGAHVVINYFHSADAASATLAEIRAAGGSAETLRASVGKKDAVDAMFAQLRAQHGGIDILVNNAAKGTLAPWLTLTERDWDRAMTVNLDGARWCAQAAAPLMSPRGGGTIVNLSSIGASNVFGNYATVGVSKAAVEALTRYLAVELAPLGIRVNAASAGLMDNATLPLFPEADGLRQVVQAATPLGRLATEEDLAHLAVFLSSESSGFITGQVILADGGLSLGHVMLSPPKEASVPGAGRQEPATAPQAAPQPLTVQENALPDGADRLVAVVGMGIAVPGASSPDEYWRLLNEPVEAFTEPGDRFDLTQYWSPDPTAADRTYSRVAGYLHDFRPHPDLTGWPRGRHDQAALWLRHCLAQARENVRSMPGDRSAVYVGAWPGGSQNLAETMVVDAVTDAVAARCSLKETDLVRRVLRARYPHTLDDVAHARPDGMVRDAIHGLLDNPVEVLVVDTACSSSLYAVDLGVKALLSGDCDVAYCGGVEVLDPANAVLFA
ncbi:SDR family oxidoreductase, partial [Streptomyces sp. NPDC005122]